MTSKTLSDGPWHERYPLHHGAKEGNLAQVKLYVEVKHFSPDEADGEYLKTPLMFAALERRFDVAQFLLQRSDVHVSKCTSERWTPLMMAAREGDFDIVRHILLSSMNSFYNLLNLSTFKIS
jgi:ankyrin repeat protein